MHTDRDSLTNKLKERYTRTFVVGAMADKSVLSTAMKDSIVYKDKIVIHGEDKLLFNMSFSEAIVAYQLQIDVPLRCSASIRCWQLNWTACLSLPD